MVTLGARAPQHVYSVLVLNQSAAARKVTVSYILPPDNTTQSVVLDIPPNSSKKADRRLVKQDTMTLTGRISKVALEGGNVLSEPFRGVFSPVETYSMTITSQGVLQ